MLPIIYDKKADTKYLSVSMSDNKSYKPPILAWNEPVIRKYTEN